MKDKNEQTKPSKTLDELERQLIKTYADWESYHIEMAHRYTTELLEEKSKNTELHAEIFTLKKERKKLSEVKAILWVVSLACGVGWGLALSGGLLS